MDGGGGCSAISGRRVLIEYLSCVSLGHVCHPALQNTGVFVHDKHMIIHPKG